MFSARTIASEILENILLHLRVETFRCACNLFIMFSTRTIASEILENMLLHLRAGTLDERLICLNLYEIFYSV